MTLNTALRDVLVSGIIFTEFDLRQLSSVLYDAGTLWHAVTSNFDTLTLKVGYIKRHVIKVCRKFTRNRAIPGGIIDNFAVFFAHVMSRCDMTWWSNTLELTPIVCS